MTSREPRAIARVPILTYHAVESPSVRPESQLPEDLLYLIRHEAFEAQMRYLAENDFTTLRIEDLIEPTGNLPERSVCLTFDDGRASDFEIVYPTLLRYGLKATFFVVTDRVGEPGYVTWQQLQEMSAHGMSIQSHTRTHPFLSRCTRQDVAAELAGSKKAIEQHLGNKVRVLALPNGDWREEHLPIVKACGYQAVCTSKAGTNQGNLYALERLSVRRKDSLEKVVSLVTLDPRALLVNRVKASSLGAAKTVLGLDAYNRVRGWLLRVAGEPLPSKGPR